MTLFYGAQLNVIQLISTVAELKTTPWTQMFRHAFISYFRTQLGKFITCSHFAKAWLVSLFLTQHLLRVADCIYLHFVHLLSPFWLCSWYLPWSLVRKSISYTDTPFQSQDSSNLLIFPVILHSSLENSETFRSQFWQKRTKVYPINSLFSHL